MLEDSRRFVLDLKLERGVIRFGKLAGLKVKFEFLQFGIEPGTFLEELRVRAGILRVEVESFVACGFTPDPCQELRVGDEAFFLPFLS